MTALDSQSYYERIGRLFGEDADDEPRCVECHDVAEELADLDGAATCWDCLHELAGDEPPLAKCPTRTPEPHLLGEFPMSCYRCHVEADS